MKNILSYFVFCIGLIGLNVNGQGLEDIIVEKYYISTWQDTVLNGPPVGSVTYRIHVDMAPGYTLQTVFGYPDHPLIIETSTSFYNNKWAAATGNKINHNLLNEGSYALDSWLTLGAATQKHFGTILNEDNDGTILHKPAFTKVDGLIKKDAPSVILYELDLDAFDEKGGSKIFADNALIGVMGGVKGTNEDNKVLIAQVTTDGELYFEINVQLGTPECGKFEKYVAKNPNEGEFTFEKLTFGNSSLH